jgi:hypothetical protein
MTPGELKATQVVAIALERVSAKISTGPPTEPQEDRDPGIWGGVIPLTLTHGTPEADDVTAFGVEAPTCHAELVSG